MKPVLWQIELSLYSEKIRWALELKGVDHVRRAPPPGTHRPIALALTKGAHDRFPVMRMADGRVVGDSPAIIAALERDYPDPPLYPEDPGGRTEALEIERYFGAEVGPNMRRFSWQHLIDDGEAVRDALLPRAPAAQQRALKLALPAFRPLLRRDYEVNAESAARARDALHAAVGRIEDLTRDGDYLVGDRFSVADLTAASLLTPLICPPGREYPPARLPDAVLELRAELEARPGGRWVHEMYARHRTRQPVLSGGRRSTRRRASRRR